MKRQLFGALLLMSIIAIGCKSRFTSTSDSTGPRRHAYADPSPVTDKNEVTHGVADTAQVHTQMPMDTAKHSISSADTISAKKDSAQTSH